MFEWLVGEVSAQSEAILRRLNASLTFNPRTEPCVPERSRRGIEATGLAYIMVQMY
jgi:hypothetical protein